MNENSNKAFTLLELLAVIVILAIIALIATPIVLNIINETKKSSVKTSAEIYLDTVEKFVANETLNDNKNYDGTYVVSDNGHVLTIDSETILNIRTEVLRYAAASNHNHDSRYVIGSSDNFAPKNHASTSNEYGVGNATQYGHVLFSSSDISDDDSICKKIR